MQVAAATHFSTMNDHHAVDTLAQPSQFYTTSSIADFVNTDPASPTQYSPNSRSKTGRKTWKSSGKEKKEPVWPDFLEEALLEALEKYRPTSSKNPRELRRFPKRNAFISNYIKQKTGKGRTPKQVGSRLQQLRETCTESRVIDLITSRNFDDPDRGLSASRRAAKVSPDLRINTTIRQVSITSSPSSGTDSGVTPSLSLASLTAVDPFDFPVTPYPDDCSITRGLSSLSSDNSWPHAYVHLDLVPNNDHYGTGVQDFATTFTLDLDESGLTDTPVLTGPDAWKWQRRISVPTAMPACYYTPTVTVSSSLLAAEGRYESSFRVMRDQKTLFEESTQLDRVSEGPTRPCLFRTTLLPKSWGSISTKASDLRQCTVIQDLYELNLAGGRVGSPIYSVIYNFDGSFPFEHSSDTSYFPPPSTYHTVPSTILHEQRIPLAPIVTNPTCTAADLAVLHYDYDTAEIPLLPPLSVCEQQQQQQPTPSEQWVSPMYLANTYYQPNAYAFSPEQSVGVLDHEVPSYQSLYPF